MAGENAKRGRKTKQAKKPKASKADNSKAMVVYKAPKAKKSSPQPTPGNGAKWLNEQDYVRMALDPCNSKLVNSPFGSTENAYIWRVNYRFTLAADASGNLLCALYPKAVVNSGSVTAPWLIQGIRAADTTTLVTAAANVMPPALAQLKAMAAQVRVTAGCVGLQYIGAAQNAAGRLYGWEGQGDLAFQQYSNTNGLQNVMAPADFMNNGRVYPITAGVEASLNYAKAPSAQTGYANPNVQQTDMYCPMAVVGISGGAASGLYEVTATLVVEWVPLLSDGIPTDNAVLVKPGAPERIANALKLVAPMLVRAGTSALGGYAGTISPAIKFGYRLGKALLA